MSKDFKHSEKVVIAMTDYKLYVVFRCEKHGIFGRLKSSGETTCPYKCDSGVSVLENAEELSVKFKEELFS